MTYLRNCWYMAAWSDEIEKGGMFARTILDEPVVLFRNNEGEINALLDRCPHRFAPFSKGKVDDGVISCGYHGLSFDGGGQCVHNPHGAVLKNMKVKSYPVIEAYRSIWIWMGDPEAADRDLLQDLGFLETAPDTAFSKGYLHGQANYQLYVDNILDLTHADFLHADTLGSGAWTRARAKVTETDDSVSVNRECPNEIPSPLQRSFRNLKEGERIDSWNNVDWHAPAIMVLHGGNVPVGALRDGSINTMTTLNTHIMTPETERTTHYFFATTRDFMTDDTDFNNGFAETRNRIFSTEDEPMIHAQQERMGDKDLWDLDPLLLRIDEGAVRVRRKLARMIEAENK